MFFFPFIGYSDTLLNVHLIIAIFVCRKFVLDFHLETIFRCRYRESNQNQNNDMTGEEKYAIN